MTVSFDQTLLLEESYRSLQSITICYSVSTLLIKLIVYKELTILVLTDIYISIDKFILYILPGKHTSRLNPLLSREAIFSANHKSQNYARS